MNTSEINNLIIQFEKNYKMIDSSVLQEKYLIKTKKRYT